MANGRPPEDEHNKRVLQAVSYLTEWSKHIITLSAALMVLGGTVVKDLVKAATPPLTYGIAFSLVLFYAMTLTAAWLALRLVRYGAKTVLTESPQIGSGDELRTLQTRLRWTQGAFLAALGLFCVLALLALFAWATPANVVGNSGGAIPKAGGGASTRLAPDSAAAASSAGAGLQ